MQIDIWSDVVCPWCYIGKRRLERALAGFEHSGEVTVTWHSFELDPSAPAVSNLPMTELIARKYGHSVETAREMLSDLDRLAAAEGLDYRMEQTRGGNTFDAHRLVHLARRHGADAGIEEALFAAYFIERVAISDHEVLRRVAAGVGLPPAEVDEVLAGDGFAAEVRSDERRAAEIGITGVPTFLVDGRWVVAGAQDSDTMLSVLRRAWARRVEAPAG